MRVLDLESIRIKLASPEEILLWSHGEVIKPETINYRTQKPEKDGLFDERIFGPEKDYECACGKYKRIRYKGVICDRCGVEVTKSQVRRERMGHIKLATPVSHIWFLRGVPSRMGLVLNKSSQQLEKVIYFSSYIITKVDDEARQRVLDAVENEYKLKVKKEKTEAKKNELKQLKEKVKEEVLEIKPLRILSEVVYHDISLKYGEMFEAGTGAEVIRDLFSKIDLKITVDELVKESNEAPPVLKKKVLRRLKLFQGMLRAKVKPEWMFIDVLPVLPPDLRPMVQLDGGRYASSDLNDLYRRVINRNNRLKYLQEISAPPVIVRNEKRMLQEAVDALIDNEMRKGVTTTATTGGKRLLKSLAAMLAGKQGRFRQNLLGKRVDYSGRSVIAVGPELHFGQCGLPKTLALEIFKPFVIKRILDKELAYNIRGAARIIDEKIPEVWAILEEIVKDKLVLLNRAPTLHRLGIQAFQPVLTEGETIKLHPLVCEAFNADFDGDQMAVYLPLSEEAQREAREIMLSSLNLLRPATGLPVIGPFRDIALGCYLLTKLKEPKDVKMYSSESEAIIAHEYGFLGLNEKIKVPNPKSDSKEMIETCVGRLIVNSNLPHSYPYVNKLIDNKALKALVRDIIEKYTGQEAIDMLDKVKTMGFEYCTLSGVSWGMDDLIVPKEKGKMINEAEREVEKIEEHFEKGLLSHDEKTSQKIFVWQEVKTKLEALLKTTLPEDGPVLSIISAGARATWSQPVQMAGMKGLVNNPAGDIIELPIKSSFAEGFNVLEYFISTHGARKGTADTALRTSSAGYLTRRLVDVAHDVIVWEEDCGDKKGVMALRKDAEEIEQNFAFKLVGRICLEDVISKEPARNASSTRQTDSDAGGDKPAAAKASASQGKTIIVRKGEAISWHQANQITKEEIEKVSLRSPLSCKSVRGVCQKCYGWDLSRNNLVKLGEAVGVVAAQAIGEPGTQLTLRTHHLGGVVGSGDITQGLPRIEEIFESRVPKGEAVCALDEGKVIKIDEETRVITIQPLSDKKSGSNPPSRKASDGQRKPLPVDYKIPNKIAMLVVVGDEVKENQPLCGGNLDLKKLYKSAGLEETQRYILKEVQRIYASQGVDIHDKHVEVIIQKMFSRMRIKEEGASDWITGEIVESSVFREEVERLKKLKKDPPIGVNVLLGISEVALASESFLSAASFQQTSRILIKASLEGKEDKLRGLKENVIIGKLIPVGTGFRPKN